MKRFQILKSTLKTFEEDYSAKRLAELGKIGFEDNGFEIKELDETSFIARKKDETVYMQYHDITNITSFEQAGGVKVKVPKIKKPEEVV